MVNNTLKTELSKRVPGLPHDAADAVPKSVLAIRDLDAGWKEPVKTAYSHALGRLPAYPSWLRPEPSRLAYAFAMGVPAGVLAAVAAL